MKIVIQRVSEASVAVAGEIVGQIRGGLLLLVGIEPADTSDDIAWIVKKIVQLRIFSDDEGLMNCSLIDVDGDLLVISQFTLHASTKKGNRPSFMRAAQPAIAIPLYESLLQAFEQILGKRVERGIFGADMQVRLLNDGPVTIIIDSQNKE